MTTAKAILIGCGLLLSGALVSAHSSRNQKVMSEPVNMGQTIRISRSLDGRVISASAIAVATQNQPNPTGSVVVEVTNASQQAAKFDVSDVTLWYQDGTEWMKLGRSTHYVARGQNLTVRQQEKIWLEPGEILQITVHYELRNRTNQKKAHQNTNVNLANVRFNNLIFDFDDDMKTTSRLS